MKVVILCGGEGTRMKEETEFKPKPLVEVGGKPILWHIMKIYAHYGFNEFVLTLGYKGNMIKEYFLNWRTFVNDFTMNTKANSMEFHNNGHDDFKITFVDTGLKSLTGERVRRVRQYLGGEDFMLTYGDGVANIDINQLVNFHRQKGKIGTITGTRPMAKLGIVEHDEASGMVTGFRQSLIGKPGLGDPQYNFIINGGFMVFQNKIFDYIRPDSMIEESFLDLSAQGELALYHHQGKWKAMDTYKEVEEMNEYWQNDPFWKVWENPTPPTTQTPKPQYTQSNFKTNDAMSIESLNTFTRELLNRPLEKNLTSSPLFGKRVLVTGGTGLVGSHLVERLLSVGAKVFCTVRSKDPQSYFYQNNFDQKTTTIDCDLTDQERIFDIVSKYEIEYIYHLGAQPIVATSFINPHETFLTNIMGTVNILEAARKTPYIKGVIVASSDKAYGKDCIDATEDHPLAGDHPYDVSKSCADLIATSYWRTYQLPVVVARFGNIFGPGDLNMNRIIPGIMKSLHLGDSLEIRSDGNFVRDYVFVKDVVEGYLLLGEKMEQIKGEAFNFSTGYNFSVLQLIKVISAAVGKECKYVVKNNQVNEIPFQSLNFRKATEVLGWKPVYTLEQGILDTYYWYKDFFNPIE